MKLAFFPKITAAAFVLLICIPTAGYANDSFAAWHDGKPKEFTTTLHATASNASFTATITGEYEGKSMAYVKAKFFATVFVQREKTNATLQVQAVMQGRDTYIKIQSIDGVIGVDSGLSGLALIENRWQKIATDDVWLQLLAPFTFDDFIAGMNIQAQRLPDGLTYSIRSRSSATLWLPTYLRHLSYGFLPELSGDAQSVLHAKIDATAENEFRYGRFWIAIDHALAQINLRLSGSMQRLFRPVYIAVPQDYDTIDSLQRYVPIDWFTLPQPTVAIEVQPPRSRLYDEPTPYFSLPRSVESIFKATNYIPSYAEEFMDYSKRTRQAVPVAPKTVVEPSRYGVHSSDISKPSRRLMQRSIQRQQQRRSYRQH